MTQPPRESGGTIPARRSAGDRVETAHPLARRNASGGGATRVKPDVGDASFGLATATHFAHVTVGAYRLDHAEEQRNTEEPNP